MTPADLTRIKQALTDEVLGKVCTGCFTRATRAELRKYIMDVIRRACPAEEALEHRREICLCAAVRLPDGYIIRGHRHHDCLRTARLVDAGPGSTQGFLTSHGRFVDRLEGARLHLAAGGTLAHPPNLYSEDLY